MKYEDTVQGHRYEYEYEWDKGAYLPGWNCPPPECSHVWWRYWVDFRRAKRCSVCGDIERVDKVTFKSLKKAVGSV